MTTSTTSDFQLLHGLLGDTHHHQRIVEVVAGGDIVGIQFFTYGLLANANQPEQIDKINALKERLRPNQPRKPAAVIIDDISRISSTVDPAHLHPQIYRLISEYPDDFAKRIAAKALIRLPVIPGSSIGRSQLHNGIVSTENGTSILQVLYLGKGHPLGHELVKELYAHPQIDIVGVSSMNKTGTGTITDPDQAYQFCVQNRISHFITDPTLEHHPHRAGSYPILSLCANQPQLIREGNLSPHLVYRSWLDIFPTTSPTNKPPTNPITKLLQRFWHHITHLLNKSTAKS